MSSDQTSLEIKAVPPSAVFHAFTFCIPLEEQPLPLLLDTRDYKAFKQNHIMQSYCVRVGGEGRALLDYSKSKYTVPWSKDCWWGKHVIVYGDAGMKRDHPVLAFLHKQGRVASLSYVKEGFPAIQAAHPYLCTTSVKNIVIKRYPGEIVPRLLYLGDWDNALDTERLVELNVKTVITIHNEPGNIKLPSRFKHVRFPLADVSTEDISQFFAPTYDIIDGARAKGHAVLVHCGAGVSRSASLCIAFLMRDRRITAHEALQLVVERRSIAQPNDGFWRMLCALEKPLGLQQRSDVKELSGHPGRDASSAAASVVGKVALAEDAAGAKVEVCWVPAGNAADHGAAAPSRKRGRSPEGGGMSPEGRRVRFKEEGSRDRPAGDRNEPGPTLADPYIVLEVQRDGSVLGEYQVGRMTPSQVVLFGRLPTCDVHLEHLSISRQHAQLQVQRDGRVTLTDMGSGHGTNVDGVWVRANAPKVLRVGTVVKFGASTRALVVKRLPGGTGKQV